MMTSDLNFILNIGIGIELNVVSDIDQLNKKFLNKKSNFADILYHKKIS